MCALSRVLSPGESVETEASLQLFPDACHGQLFVHPRMTMISRCAAAMSLALICLFPMQRVSAETFPIPIPPGDCGTTQCLIFNFDFTNPPQSLQPPYIAMDLAIPVNILKPFVSLSIVVFDGLDGSGFGHLFLLPTEPFTGPTTFGVDVAEVGSAQEGIFSIAITTNRAGETLLTSAPLATAAAFAGTICFPPFCPTVTIVGVEFAPVPGPSVPGPDGIVLISVGAGAIGLLRRRRRSHRTRSMA